MTNTSGSPQTYHPSQGILRVKMNSINNYIKLTDINSEMGMVTLLSGVETPCFSQRFCFYFPSKAQYSPVYKKLPPRYFTDLNTSCESRRTGTISFTKVLPLGPISQWLGKDRPSCPTLGPTSALHCGVVLWDLISSLQVGSGRKDCGTHPPAPNLSPI